MIRPEGFHTIRWIKYDKRTTAGGDPDYQVVTYMEPVDFLRISDRRNVSDSDVTAMILTNSTHVINVKNDIAPTHWTILEGYDDIVFDSYNVALDTNLQNSKSLAYGSQRPVLALTDAAIPDLPQNLMQLLKNRARAFYFDVYKGGTTKEVDKRQRNSEVRAQRLRHITTQSEKPTGPNYGRK